MPHIHCTPTTAHWHTQLTLAHPCTDYPIIYSFWDHAFFLPSWWRNRSPTDSAKAKHNQEARMVSNSPSIQHIHSGYLPLLLVLGHHVPKNHKSTVSPKTNSMTRGDWRWFSWLMWMAVTYKSSKYFALLRICWDQRTDTFPISQRVSRVTPALCPPLLMSSLLNGLQKGRDCTSDF